MPLSFNQWLSDLVNVLTFSCSFRWRASFSDLIDFNYSFSVPCSFWNRPISITCNQATHVCRRLKATNVAWERVIFCPRRIAVNSLTEKGSFSFINIAIVSWFNLKWGRWMITQTISHISERLQFTPVKSQNSGTLVLSFLRYLCRQLSNRIRQELFM